VYPSFQGQVLTEIDTCNGLDRTRLASTTTGLPFDHVGGQSAAGSALTVFAE
jgi:hypothetical protein